MKSIDDLIAARLCPMNSTRHRNTDQGSEIRGSDARESARRLTGVGAAKMLAPCANCSVTCGRSSGPSLGSGVPRWRAGGR